MKNKKTKIFLLMLLALIVMIGCSSESTSQESEVSNETVEAVESEETEKEEETKEDEQAEEPEELGSKEVIKVGVTSLNQQFMGCIEEVFEANTDYDLEVVTFTDNLQPNFAVDEGSLDVNIYQHDPYLVEFNQEQGTDLKNYKSVVLHNIGIFSDKYEKLEDLPDGATIGICNDPSNRAIALMILEEQGLIKLDGKESLPTLLNIEENPHNFEILEVGQSADLIATMPDLDAIVVESVFIVESGRVASSYLALGSIDLLQEWADIIVVKEENLEADWLEPLYKAFESDEFKKYLEDNYKGVISLATDLNE